MHVVTWQDAPRYDAPGHHRMEMRRLQGREAGPADSLWIGLSTLEPGGGTSASAAEVEKFYVVLEGRLEVQAELDGVRRVAELLPLHSVRIAPGETRTLRNPGPAPCKVLLVMPQR
jgi:quercetin dioxygenase-like cupin family protein